MPEKTIWLVAALFLMPTAAMAQRKLMPDGETYVYYTNVGDNTEIFTIKMDGTERRQLTHHPFHDYNPQWSFDGTKIVFYRKHPEEDQADLYLMDAEGSGLVQITNTPHYEGDPSFSPDDRKIVFTSNQDGDYEIFAMEADGTEEIQLTFNEVDDYSPAWSPDGSKIMFVSNRSGSYELYTVKADGTAQTRLTHTGADNYKPAWSPDGTRVAFFTNRDGNFEAYVMNADGTRPVNVSDSPDWNDFSQAWMPGGTALLYTAAGGPKPGVYRVSLETGERAWLFEESILPPSDAKP